MKQIKALIINQLTDSQRIIEYAVARFNESSQGMHVSIVGRAAWPNEADVLLSSPPEPVQLVFLNDYVATWSPEFSFQLSRRHPDLAYIVTSVRCGIVQRISEEKAKVEYDYMETVSEGGNWNLPMMTNAIRSYAEHLKKQ